MITYPKHFIRNFCNYLIMLWFWVVVWLLQSVFVFLLKYKFFPNIFSSLKCMGLFNVGEPYFNARPEKHVLGKSFKQENIWEFQSCMNPVIWVASANNICLSLVFIFTNFWVISRKFNSLNSRNPAQHLLYKAKNCWFKKSVW